MRTLNVTNVGAPDPELETSPIVDDEMDEFVHADLEMESAACCFNGETYPIGTYVRSGPDLLCCDRGGVWVRKGPSHE